MMHPGKLLVLAGLVMILAGVFLLLPGDKLSWFGKLPGDFRYERGNFRFYAPLATMFLLSLLFSILWKLVSYLSGRL